MKAPLHTGTSKIETNAHPGNYLTNSMLNSKVINNFICPAKVLAKTPFEKIKGKILNSFNNFIDKKN